MKPIGEVLSSSITGLTAEAWHQDDKDGLPESIRPHFGSFLRVDCADERLQIYAVVYNVITGPQDSLHKPTALKLSREQLKVEQPHIFALLKTEIHAVTVGYSQDSEFYDRLPPQPAQVHDFIYAAEKEELKRITENLDFVRLISGVSSVPSDELIAAAIREAASARNQDYQFLKRAGQSLSHVFRDDYDRLVTVLRKIKPE